MSTAHVQVVADMPATPLLVVAAQAVEQVGQLAERANALKIATPQDAETASAMLVDVSNLSKLIETRRKEAKEPFLEMGKKIDAAVRPYADKLNAVALALRPKLAAWHDEQERIAREEERKRQTEIRRLEDEKRKAEEAARAAQQSTAGDDFSDFDATIAETKAAATSEAIVNLQAARAIVQPAKPAGVTFRTTLEATVTDVHKLPTAFVVVTANMEAIRKAHCVGWKEGDPLPVVPGIRFEAKKSTVVFARR